MAKDLPKPKKPVRSNSFVIPLATVSGLLILFLIYVFWYVSAEDKYYLGAQQKLTCSASEKCPRRGTRFRNQFEIVRYYPAKKITLIPRRAARAVKGARRAFILTLDSPSRPIESQRERSETKYSEASFRSCPVFSWWNASVTLHGLFVVDFTLGDRAVEGLECGRCGSSGGGDSRALRPWGGCPES